MLPQTTVEQRSKYYDDVEGLLVPGFLTHSVIVGGVRLHMRSLGAGDLFMLRARTEGLSSYEWRLWSVATSIWMINGRTVLGHDEVIPFIADYLRKIPRNALEILFSILLGLWVRVGDAVESIEVFCFETLSRYKWKTIGSGGLLHTGVPGAEGLGLNAVQRIWTAFNEMEDNKRKDEAAWEGFKLVASSNAPKAITKMDKRDQQRRDDDIQKRQRLLDVFFYSQLGLMDAKGAIVGGGSMHRIDGPKTVEHLEEEMRRWVTDDQDPHDRVVTDYKDRIRAERAAVRAEREARQTALKEKREEMGWENGTFRPQPLVAMTAQQLQAVLAQKGYRPGVQFIPKSLDSDRVFSRYMSNPEETGGLQVVDGKVVDPNSDPEMDHRTLNELIQGRNPAFGNGE